MTSVRLRTDPDELDPVADLLLTLNGVNDRDSNIHIGHGFFGKGPDVPESAARLFQLAAAVFAADRMLPRSDVKNGDRWARTIDMSVPEDACLAAAVGPLADTLDFLTGDHWTFATEGRHGNWQPAHSLPDFTPDAVCLFSGGLDSFSGAIAGLESGQSLVLVGHHDASHAASCQRQLFDVLDANYPDRVVLKQLRLDPRTESEPEKTQRSRSLLFLAAGLTVATVLGPSVPLVLPENGFISLNVPLTASRRGSASTRTTHPHFIRQFADVAASLGIVNPLRNPFQFDTKGELLQKVAETSSFQEGARDSVSCSHPDEHRWDRNTPKVNSTSVNCGYCYPCLIRRAAMYTVGMDHHRDYVYDAFLAPHLHDADKQSGADLSAVMSALQRPAVPGASAAHGPLGTRAEDHEHTYRRGREELATWLRTAPATSPLHGRL